MQKQLILLGICLSCCTPFSVANTPSTIITEKETLVLPELNVMSAQGNQMKQEPVADLPLAASNKINLEALSDGLLKDKALIERLLNIAIESRQIDVIKKLLPIYQKFPTQDRLLVLFAQAKIAKSEGKYSDAITYLRQMLAISPDLTPVRIKLGIVLFLEQQDNSAKEQFNKALSDLTLPSDIQDLVNQYLLALEKRDSWNVKLSVRYLNEENVNNASSSLNIENTAFVKGRTMLPQKANGVGYTLGLERDFNLLNAHYLHFENYLLGKNYWDNHDYDDIINRTYLGYRNKNAKQNWSILPFYEQQWYGNHRYKWAGGVRAEYRDWVAKNWQISTALEYSRNHYHSNTNLNGNNKLASFTLVWQRNPRQFFYTGFDFSRETTLERSYSYDLKTARVGWGQEWSWGISSRVNTSISNREYKADLRLGSVFSFSKPREDNIYSVGVTVWKRDWHLWSVTPKLNYSWKKQDSNFDSLYSYSDSSINLFFEKSF